MAGLLELRNAGFSVQNRKLVRDATYSFDEGKITALVGPSGSGKSTVLKLAAGLLVPDTGEVAYKDKSIALMNRKENLEFRREAAFVFQDSALWANQNLFQILELPLRVHFPKMTKTEREKRIEAVIADVGYRKDLGIRPSQLSMGEQKMLAFARAIICRPSLLFLDEWTESLDENSANRLIRLVKQHNSTGGTAILVSHDMRIIIDISDIVVMILGGQIFLKLTKEQITEDEDLRRYIEMGMQA
ncbi:MAG: ATP-binding cassette domain-containing protein [Treponema sp.]|nr:ATP-binding cassette domain-containing protein [Treponema sp.]